LTEAGLHDKVKVFVGRAPVTAKYSAEIGADRCTQDAADQDTAHEFLTQQNL
jgi:methanogenic corrinoid protein MtbC1